MGKKVVYTDKMPEGIDKIVTHAHIILRSSAKK
jgi:hypothetical protein